jgi:hypothetical protein
VTAAFELVIVRPDGESIEPFADEAAAGVLWLEMVGGPRILHATVRGTSGHSASRYPWALASGGVQHGGQDPHALARLHRRAPGCRGMGARRRRAVTPASPPSTAVLLIVVRHLRGPGTEPVCDALRSLDTASLNAGNLGATATTQARAVRRSSPLASRGVRGPPMSKPLE